MDEILDYMKDIIQTEHDINAVANAMILDQMTYEETTNALIGIASLHKIRTNKLMDLLTQILHLDDDDFPNNDQETSEK